MNYLIVVSSFATAVFLFVALVWIPYRNRKVSSRVADNCECVPEVHLEKDITRQAPHGGKVYLPLLLFCIAVLFGFGCGFPALAPNPSKSDIQRWSVPLSAENAKALGVYYKNHDNIYDARVHTGKTCPILVYTPKYNAFQAGTLSSEAWAAFLLRFFKAKHKEEDSCKCVQELGLIPEPSEVRNPCPVLVDGQPCGKPSERYKKDADFKYLRCTAGHEWKQPRR